MILNANYLLEVNEPQGQRVLLIPVHIFVHHPLHLLEVFPKLSVSQGGGSQIALRAFKRIRLLQRIKPVSLNNLYTY